MIRSSLTRTASRVVHRLERHSSSAQKRALNKQQIDGSKKTAKAVTGTTGNKPPGSGGSPPPPPTTTTTATTNPTGGSGSGSSSTTPLLGVAAVTVGLGAAYYMDLIPGMSTAEKPKEVSTETTTTTTTDSSVDEAPAKETEVPTEEEKEEPPALALEVTTTETDASPSTAPVVEETEEPVKEETVAPVAPIKMEETKEANDTTDRPTLPDVTDNNESVVVEEAPPALTTGPTTTTTLETDEPTVQDAMEELRGTAMEEESRTLKEAHRALRANLDESLLDDLDQLTPSQLKVRVVQLASEMKERTKWEAVRLREFLAMKEKETSEKYMELMQKQRQELENILAQRIREQEDALIRQSNTLLQQKEESTQKIVEKVIGAAEADYEAQLAAAKERLEKEIGAKFEKEFGNELKKTKTDYANELNAKVTALQDLASKVQNLQSALTVSRTFEAGSLVAHKVSAAAMALAEKLETSQGAAVELSALEAAAEANSVIGSAISTIPSAAKAGVPTLPELQAKFEEIHGKARQAALVPDGRLGLDGQLMGMLFSTLKYAPSPDDPLPDDSKDEAEYLLARARRHLQLGELENSVEQMDKLQGQTALTVRDWTQAAKDRVAINKALHVIKLESAMMNESMSTGGTGN